MMREEDVCNTHWEINRKTHLRLWTGGHKIRLTAAEERQLKTTDLKTNLVFLNFYKTYMIRTKVREILVKFYHVQRGHTHPVQVH